MVIHQSRFEANGLTVIVHHIDMQNVYYEKRRDEYSGKDWPQDGEANPLRKMPVGGFVKAVAQCEP